MAGTLQPYTWEQFKTLLVSDRDIKANNHNLGSHRYYFNRVRNRFLDIPFTNATLRIWKKELVDQGIQPSTFNKIKQMCDRINQLFELGIQITISRMRETQKDFETLTDEEIIQIANVEMDYGKGKEYLNKRNRAFYLMAGLNCGNRLQEAIVVPWVDLREAPKRHIVFRDTKNGLKRDVKLSNMVWEAIQDIPRMRPNAVFCSYRGEIINQNYASTMFSEDIRDRCRAIGISEDRIATTDTKEGISFYTLRHSFATNRLNDPNNTLTLLEIAYHMGHQDIRNLQRYVRKSLEISERVVKSVPAFAGETSPEEKMQEVRQAIQRLTQYHPDFDPIAIQKLDLTQLLRK